MPPREATGTFPDQYLQFDYEAVAANMVVPALEGGPPLEAESPPIDPLSIDPSEPIESPLLSQGGPIEASVADSSSSTSSISMQQEEQEDDDDEEEEEEDDDSLEGTSMIQRNSAFEEESPRLLSPISLRFGETTSLDDLKYFCERGCIVGVLQALDSPRLVTLGTRMLADYAKMAHRRLGVASNRRILAFVQETMESATVLGREYAVETIRSLTATEASDIYLMQAPGLLETLAKVARQGLSEKARLHACIAIMNLSCGKANKIGIAKLPAVTSAMVEVIQQGTPEARLKATTCLKNLSNADANDAALLHTPGLLQALGYAARVSNDQACTNACLCLMNLSIAKANKHTVFKAPGVMEALLHVLQGRSSEARTKACSALSNLAIGYDNKIPMFEYPGFVECILEIIQTDTGEARTKACSILWSFAAEMKNQVPVVQRQDVLPVLVQVAQEDTMTEARFKCVAALTLLAESLENAVPLLHAGALAPIMDILHEAGPDPTNWKGQTASWCVGFLMNMAQSDQAVVPLRESGVVELLQPLLLLDHYQSLKAAMAVTFCCRFDVSDECYDLLRKTETVIPKIVRLFSNTLQGSGGNGYKYGVFTLRSSIGCIAALASGPDFIKEAVATLPVVRGLIRVVTDFCVDGGTPGAIVGGGRDDAASATLAIGALHALTQHLIPIVGSCTWPFGELDEACVTALESLEACTHPEISNETRDLASDTRIRVQSSAKVNEVVDVSHCCAAFEDLPDLFGVRPKSPGIVSNCSLEDDMVRTFLLTDATTGRRFVVPCDATGGRAFHDTRVWCFRRGRFCQAHEEPDRDYVWNASLQDAYERALETSK